MIDQLVGLHIVFGDWQQTDNFVKLRKKINGVGEFRYDTIQIAKISYQSDNYTEREKERYIDNDTKEREREKARERERERKTEIERQTKETERAKE